MIWWVAQAKTPNKLFPKASDAVVMSELHGGRTELHGGMVDHAAHQLHDVLIQCRSNLRDCISMILR